MWVWELLVLVTNWYALRIHRMQTSSEDCWLYVYIRYTASLCIRMWKPGNRPKKSSLMTSRPFAQDCWKIFYEVKLEFKCSFGLVLHDETKIQTWNGLFCFTSVYFSTQNPLPLLYVCRYSEFLFFPFSGIGIVLIFLRKSPGF